MDNPNTILSVRFEKFQLSRFLRFIDVVVDLGEDSGILEPKLVAVLGELRQHYQTMQSLLNKRRSLPITKEIEAVDHRRDV